MPSLTCLGRGEEIDISGLTEGDCFECAHCADLTLELVRQEGRLTLQQVHRVSCSLCSKMLEVPERARAGNTMSCCDRTFRLTYEFGAYALG